MFDLVYRLIKGSPRTLEEDDGNLSTIQGGLIRAPQRVAQSYAGFARTSTNTTGGTAGDNVFVTVASIMMPGNTMGPNSKLVIIPDWDWPSSASTKFLAVDFGGQNISGPSVTTSVMGKLLVEVQNLNSQGFQKTMNANTYGTWANARLATSVDTTQDVAIDFKIKWSAAQTPAETISLLGYSIIHYPGS